VILSTTSVSRRRGGSAHDLAGTVRGREANPSGSDDRTLRANRSDWRRTFTVGYFVGSLSSTSINRQLAEALIKLAPDDLDFHEISIASLPLYSPDHDLDYPPEATALKQAIGRSDAVLFVTPSTTGRFQAG
jgi:hypothetical protein